LESLIFLTVLKKKLWTRNDIDRSVPTSTKMEAEIIKDKLMYGWDNISIALHY